jgi:lysozyme
LRQINSEGLRIVEYYESLQLKAYRDIKGILTIGYGHTGSDVFDGQVITYQEAQDLLKKDLGVAESAVERCVRSPMNDNQFSACVSLCFNIGQTAFQKSTLVQFLNQQKYLSAADQFLIWDHANGKVVGGLLARRRAEKELFLS